MDQKKESSWLGRRQYHVLYMKQDELDLVISDTTLGPVLLVDCRSEGSHIPWEKD